MNNLRIYISSIIIALFLLIGNIGLSQTMFSGQIRDNISYAGVPGHTVYIVADTTNQQNFTYSNTITTNSQGFFYDTVNVSGYPGVKFYISTLDCVQNIILDSVYSSYPVPKIFDICTNGLNMCLADYIAYPDSGNYQSIHFYNISSINTTTYLWNFGDSNYAVAKHPIHTFNLGSYQVCLTAYDSVSGCYDTHCDTITITPQMNCNNSFTFQNVTQKTFAFHGNINSAYPTIYNWDFGDMTTTNGKDVQHTFSQPGIYTVKLSSTSFHPQTLDTCISHSQQDIVVTGPPTAGIWGQVFADSVKIDHAKVYLYSFDNSNNRLSLKDSTDVLSIDSIGISYYHFKGLNYGKYVVFLKLLPNSSFKLTHAPAYSGNTLYWNQALVSDLNQVSTNVPINLTHLYSLNGNSSISGGIFEGNKASPGDPISNIPLYLLDQNKVVIDFQYSDANGKYKFDNLTEQKYFIYADVINHNIFPATNTISELNQHHSNINIYISPGAVTGINNETMDIEFKIYPNPTTSIINISFVNPKSQDIEFTLVNILGQAILSKNFFSEEQSRNQLITLDISDTDAGIYILQIKSGNKIMHNQKIIISK